MSKKQTLKLYTITETVHIEYKVLAVSEDDAQDHYRNMESDKFQELLSEAASNNFCDDEVVDTEDFTVEEAIESIDADETPVTEKAKGFINRNLPE